MKLLYYINFITQFPTKSECCKPFKLTLSVWIVPNIDNTPPGDLDPATTPDLLSFNSHLTEIEIKFTKVADYPTDTLKFSVHSSLYKDGSYVGRVTVYNYIKD